MKTEPKAMSSPIPSILSPESATVNLEPSLPQPPRTLTVPVFAPKPSTLNPTPNPKPLSP